MNERVPTVIDVVLRIIDHSGCSLHEVLNPTMFTMRSESFYDRRHFGSVGRAPSKRRVNVSDELLREGPSANKSIHVA